MASYPLSPTKFKSLLNEQAFFASGADEDKSLRGPRFGYAGGPERSFVPQQFLAGLTPPWCIGLSPPADSKNRPRPGHRKNEIPSINGVEQRAGRHDVGV